MSRSIGNSHVKRLGCSCSGLGMKISDSGLIYGVHDEMSLFSPAKVSFEVGL